MGNVGYYTDPSQKLFFQKTNFMGGINNGTSDDLVPENCEKNLVNFDLSYAGALSKRAGFIRHTNLHFIPKLNEFSNFADYPTLLLDKTQKALKDCSMVQGIFQWKDSETSKEYIIMLYCNQVYIKLSTQSETIGSLNDYEQWKPVTMQKYDEANSTYTPYLTGTTFERVLFKENADQTAIAVDVPIFSKVYDSEGGRRTIVGKDAWEKFIDEDLAKTYKVDGIAYGGAFYLATGYKLMVIKNENGTITAKQIAPIVPTTPEYNTIGGNLLSVDPANAIKSSTGVALQVSGMVITSDYENKRLQGGLVNHPINIKAIVIRPSASYEVYYRFKYQKQGQDDWTNKATTQSGWEKMTLSEGVDPTWQVLLNQATLYNFSIEITPSSNIDTSNWTVNNTGLVESYVYTSFEVKEVPSFMASADFSLHTCRRLLVYYDQLLAYQDTADGNVLYISDYRRFDYFPADYNTIVDTATKDEITSINYFQNVLVLLTERNIFMLKGRNPYDFALTNINRTIGCKYGWTARAVGNYLYFMSIEGLFRLKSIYNTEDRLNVEQVDFKINTLFSKNADDYIAFTFKGNYYLVEMTKYIYEEGLFRTSENGKIYIYDSYLEAWTSYSGKYLNINNVLILGNNICAVDRNTNSFLVYPDLKVLDKEIKRYIDGETYYINDDGTELVKTGEGTNYLTRLEETYNSLGKPYHTKKFKEIMIKTLNSREGKTGLMVTVDVDGAYVVNPEKYTVNVDPITGTVSVQYFNKDGAINGEYAIELLENVSIPTIATLGKSFEVGEALLGDYDISLHKIKYSGKGKTVKYIIEQVDDKFFGILGHSTIYKEKKPSVK